MSRSPLTYLGGLLALYLLVPIVLFVARFAVSSDRGFESPGLADAFRTSIASASISTAIIAVLGIPLAYVLARSNGIVSRGVRILVQLPLALPPVMSGIVLIYVVGPYTFLGELFGDRLTDSIVGIVIAQTFVASPFLVIAARSAFASLDPAWDDLAATLGHRPIVRFFRVALPAASSGIAAGVLLTWLRALGEYGATVLLAYHPYSLPVFTSVQFQSTGIPGTQAPTALALGIAIVAVLVGLVRWSRLARAAEARRERKRRIRGGDDGGFVPVAPRRPSVARPTPIAFDLDVTVGSFRLDVAHRAESHRIAILGPSGSGKSLTLKAIAGLLGASVGEVRLDGDDVSSTVTENRLVGYVPQGGAVLPGRTVRQQLAFGRGADAGVAAWWVSTLRLDGLEDRYPDELSGGQRQRVALASALSREPRVVLLDEPFSALDVPVREELRRELRRLQHETGLSTVLVTHDPEEAALLADEIIVVAGGRLLQAGSRREVYGRPASPEVARLLGIQNLARGVAGESVYTSGTSFAPGTPVLWSIRPERVLLTDDGNDLGGAVVDVADLGATTSVTLRLGDGTELRSLTIGDALIGGRPVSVGDDVRVHMAPSDVVVWPDRDTPTATA